MTTQEPGFLATSSVSPANREFPVYAVNWPIYTIPSCLIIPNDQKELVPSPESISKKRYATSVDERNYLTVYEYQINNQWIIWDYHTGYVHLTGLWKAIGNSKADIVKLIDNSPDLEAVIRRVRGGYLKIQGTWVPYDIARALASRTCYFIRFALIPLFGQDFPGTCLKPHEPGFGYLQMHFNSTKKRRKSNAKAQQQQQALAHATSPTQHNHSTSPARSPMGHMMHSQSVPHMAQQHHMSLSQHVAHSQQQQQQQQQQLQHLMSQQQQQRHMQAHHQVNHPHHIQPMHSPRYYPIQPAQHQHQHQAQQSRLSQSAPAHVTYAGSHSHVTPVPISPAPAPPAHHPSYYHVTPPSPHSQAVLLPRISSMPSPPQLPHVTRKYSNSKTRPILIRPNSDDCAIKTEGEEEMLSQQHTPPYTSYVSRRPSLGGVAKPGNPVRPRRKSRLSYDESQTSLLSAALRSSSSVSGSAVAGSSSESEQDDDEYYRNFFARRQSISEYNPANPPKQESPEEIMEVLQAIRSLQQLSTGGGKPGEKKVMDINSVLS
ncbi:Transcriptional repressor XBP1 [Yarrowia sp. C11]|nr:Transcriptional repressor XBP1 [Yarrowia sp. C11]KAG5364329.1 Transcriptional repressor XBP1 [Yarrowia sp. E02]